jgi:DNA-binding NarL/FixJ family response regulator
MRISDNKLSVLVVDNCPVVRIGLKQLFAEEYRGVVFAEAINAHEASVLTAKQPWDLIIFNLSLPCRNAYQVLRESLDRRPGTRVLVLGLHSSHNYAQSVRQLGAFGYLPLTATRPDLVKAFKSVLAGKKWFNKSVIGDPDVPIGRSPLHLSARENRILLAIAAGKHSSEIAQELNLNITTVSTYKRRILNKTGLRSSADLVRYVIENQLA